MTVGRATPRAADTPLKSDAFGSDLARRLAGCTVGGTLRAFDSVDSTNLALQRLAAEGTPAGTVVLADEQTAGKGRLGRRWHSPRGTGLWFSFLLRPLALAGAPWAATVAASLGVADGVRSLTGLAPRIKWPNDLLLDGRKVCGILTEVKARGDGTLDVIVGVGLNVNARTADFPDALRGRATSLREAGGEPVPRAALFEAVVRAISSAVDALDADGISALLARWRAASATLGRRVRVEAGGFAFEGLASDVDVSGALVVITDSRKREVVTAGDVSLIEPIG